MSDSNAQRTHGMMAEFASVESLLAAARRIRDAGYTKIDAYTPFAVHGIDEALGIKPTALPWLTLAGGAIGAITALSMQIWMNSINYPYIISGKPFISLPAFIPVAFELTILFASFGTFFGMLALNKLPRFSNPMFTNPRFDAATDDKFFLYVDAEDSRYDQEGVARLLGDSGAASVDPVIEDQSPTTVPKIFFTIATTLAMLSILPVLVVAMMRVTTSQSPRFHVFYDMDFSPAKEAQQVTTLFADGRAMRPDVPGTVARSQGGYDADFMTGVDVDALAAMDPARARHLVNYNAQPPAGEPATVEELDAVEESAVEQSAVDQPSGEQPAAETPPADSPAPAGGAEQPAAGASTDQGAAPQEAAAEGAAAEGASQPIDNTPWLQENPLEVTSDVLLAGQRNYNIFCAVCHGVNGRGAGLVNQRAQRIQAVTWVQPTSLHQDYLLSGHYPDGKLFSVITNGIRKMPAYGPQISAADRWAVVAYVRALQLSQNAQESDVPDAQKPAVTQAQ